MYPTQPALARFLVDVIGDRAGSIHAFDPETARVVHLLNRHQFHLKKGCMIETDYPRGARVKVDFVESTLT